MYIERHAVAVTTDASGDVTGYTPVVTGQVLQVRYVPDGTSPLDTGADVTISGEVSGVVVLVATNIGTSARTWQPQQAAHKASDGAALLYAAAGEPVTGPVVVASERVKVVVAQGGNAKLGTFYVYVGG